ncbi:hypothetical protein MKW92_022912 [Papaver armeniacum]|nr:hypothetical protein MKW92_022912 [Papaver armeniacum]
MVAGKYGVALAVLEHKEEGLVAEADRGLAWMDGNVEKMEKISLLGYSPLTSKKQALYASVATTMIFEGVYALHPDIGK